MTRNGISYSVSGYEEKGVIVALHGVTDNAASLSDLAQQWNGEWKVYLVDALGHGLSRPFDEDELADPFPELVTAIRSIVIEAARRAVSRKVVLMGHSLGGAIATVIAREVPHLIQALVIEDPALLTHEQWEIYRDSAHDLAMRQTLVTEHVGEAITELMKVYSKWPVSEYGAWAQGKTQVDRRFVATGVVGTYGREILAEVSVPTLLLTGDQDDVLFGVAGQAELERLGNSNISSILISEASHTVRRDRPEEFYRAVNEFLERNGGRPERPDAYICDELRAVMEETPVQSTDDYVQMRRDGDTLLAGAIPLEGIRVEQFVVDDPDYGVAALPLRCLKAAGEPGAVVLSIHGGGYIAGAARYDDTRNSELVELFQNAIVVSPDYRLAPENPWPEGAMDCAYALHYLAQTYPNLPLYVYGDSAGAGLAQQAIELVSKRRESIQIDAAILLEPCLEPSMVTESFRTYQDGPIWTREASAAAWHHYMGDPRRVPPYVPSREAAALMPPALIVVNPVDPLRDEGIRFARDLVDAGVPAELHMFAGTFHGALSAPGTRTWSRLKETIRSFLSRTENHSTRL